MSFANPIAWLLALAAGPIIVFYILKLRLRRMPVSTNLFWKQIYDEKPPRSIWQYLRHLLSLLVQLALVALLVAAVTDPYFPWQLLEARRVVVVIDNSASMRATDVSPSRLEAAVDSAVALAEGLRFRDEMAIVLAGPRPEVVVGMSSHVPTLKRALAAISLSDNPTEVAAAIELGKQLVGDHPHGQIVVFSDGCWKMAAPESPSIAPTTPILKSQPTGGVAAAEPVTHVEYRIFGSKAANLGITQFQVRRSLIDPIGYEILIAVLNASPAEVKCRIELELAGVPIDILPLTLKPEEAWSRSLEKTSLEGGRLTAKLTQIEPADTAKAKSKPAGIAAPLNGLTTDDAAWAVLPEREIQRVMLVTPGNLFLQKVLEANPLVQVEVRHDFPERWPADTIVVLHREIPTTLPPGKVFIVDPLGSCDAWEMGGVIENPIVTEQDKASSLMTHVRLDNVLMPEARQLTYKTPPKVLAGALSKDPVYAEVSRADGKCLVLTVNLDRGDLAFRTAFPILVTNALGWFAGDAGALHESLATGAVVSVDMRTTETDGDETLILSSPTGKQKAVARPALEAQRLSNESSSESETSSDVELVSLGPFDECGIWTVAKSGADPTQRPITELAVNLADAQESDLRPPDELLAQRQQDAIISRWLARPLWFYLLSAACALFVTEWFLYQRRVIT